jgi:hypothetical protein
MPGFTAAKMAAATEDGKLIEHFWRKGCRMSEGKLISIMKTFTLMLAAGLMLAGYTLKAEDATEGKEITITGSMVCGKCTLHETKSCQNVVQVKQDGKTVNYYLKQNDVSKEAHDPICGGGAEQVTVTGTVVEKDGQEIVTPKKIEPVKT